MINRGMRLTPSQARERLEEARALYLEAVNDAALALAVGASAIETARRSQTGTGTQNAARERKAVEGLLAAARAFEEARAAFATAELAIQGGRPE